MAKHLPSISIEKFAAFLDGNLAQDEMQKIENLVASDDVLQDIFDAKGIIDDSINDNCNQNIQLPFEIDNLSFDLPDVDTSLNSPACITSEQIFAESYYLSNNGDDVHGSENLDHILDSNDCCLEVNTPKSDMSVPKDELESMQETTLYIDNPDNP